MPTVADVCRFLDGFAPASLAEEWDNVGLLVGRGESAVNSIMTCLTVTPQSMEEAVEQHVNLIITHHPIPFRPLKRITTSTTVGRLLLPLIEAGVAVYSPHTAFDSTHDGINRWLAEIIGIADPKPLVPQPESTSLGAGRWGELFQPMRVHEIALRLKLALAQERIQIVGQSDCPVERAAVGCGSGGELLDSVIAARCQLFVTGETNFHTCLEAEANQLSMILTGHYASERFAVERLAVILAEAFPGLSIWASRRERDPLKWI